MSAKQTKTVTKKPTKATAKKKPAAKPKAKATPKKKATPKAKTATLKKKAATKVTPIKKVTAKKAAGTRRPPNNPDMPIQTLENITGEFNDIKTELENYAAHLRALDRKRLNGVGIKKQGFIERAYEYAVTNPEFFPHYLTLDKFGEDNQYFIGFRNLYDTCKQIQEIIWNITLQASDVVYTDALEYYASVREASKRRVDAAETIFNDLYVFFKHKKTAKEEIEIKETIKE